MAFLPQDALIRATLFQLFIHAQTSAKRLNTTEVTRRFSFQISPKRVELALEELDDDGLVECWINDGSYTITRKGYRTVEAELGKPTSFHSEYREFGDDWLSAQTIPIEGIPAADRIVTRADNQRVQEIERGLEDIIDILRRDNEAAATLGVERDLICGELRTGETLTREPMFRLGRLIALIMPGLRFLAEKFATGAIGDAARRLIALLLGLS